MTVFHLVTNLAKLFALPVGKATILRLELGCKARILAHQLCTRESSIELAFELLDIFRLHHRVVYLVHSGVQCINWLAFLLFNELLNKPGLSQEFAEAKVIVSRLGKIVLEPLHRLATWSIKLLTGFAAAHSIQFNLQNVLSIGYSKCNTAEVFIPAIRCRLTTCITWVHADTHGALVRKSFFHVNHTLCGHFSGDSVKLVPANSSGVNFST